MALAIVSKDQEAVKKYSLRRADEELTKREPAAWWGFPLTSTLPTSVRPVEGRSAVLAQAV